MNSVGGVIRRALPAEHTNSRGGRHILMKLVTLFNVNLPEDILMNLKFLKLKGLLFCCLTAATATAQPPARVMLDDFTRAVYAGIDDYGFVRDDKRPDLLRIRWHKRARISERRLELCLPIN